MAASSPYRSTCTIDGKKFDALEISVAFQTAKDRTGMPQMGSLTTSIKVVVDAHDDTNMPYSTMSSLFEMAKVVTRDKIKDMKLEFWKDDARSDALCSYQFKGWISGFHMANPAGGDEAAAMDSLNLNHMLVLDLEPAMNQQNFKDVLLTN